MTPNAKAADVFQGLGFVLAMLASNIVIAKLLLRIFKGSHLEEQGVA